MLVTGDTWYDSGGASGALDPYGPLAAQAAVAGSAPRDRRSDLDQPVHPVTDDRQLRRPTDRRR